ncbi:1784_t:CDS:2 [Funneliformis geosporum]|uniref:1783_t:CDS:1 n=1 Tax=Funneliformis geosporum TaxID=1117311 RepID=A0A9W4SEC0_9GLOM|nr:1783_t:CDS:2 [Funneliformis geosporum]CAI2166333.1 1784_t:CDS:2 [Funneliformis geosporum]
MPGIFYFPIITIMKRDDAYLQKHVSRTRPIISRKDMAIANLWLRQESSRNFGNSEIRDDAGRGINARNLECDETVLDIADFSWGPSENGLDH